MTADGCQNVPIAFLERWPFTPVLPPTLESTIARRVVGIATRRTPRCQIDAANPARSPTVPPPNVAVGHDRRPGGVEPRHDVPQLAAEVGADQYRVPAGGRVDDQPDHSFSTSAATSPGGRSPFTRCSACS